MASSLISFSSVSVVFLSALLFSATRSEADPAPAVDPLFPVCKIVVGTGIQYFDIKFCMEALSSYNGSHYAYDMDYLALSTFVVDLLYDNITSTASRIVDLLGRRQKIWRWPHEVVSADVPSVVR